MWFIPDWLVVIVTMDNIWPRCCSISYPPKSCPWLQYLLSPSCAFKKQQQPQILKTVLHNSAWRFELVVMQQNKFGTDQKPPWWIRRIWSFKLFQNFLQSTANQNRSMKPKLLFQLSVCDRNDEIDGNFSVSSPWPHLSYKVTSSLRVFTHCLSTKLFPQRQHDGANGLAENNTAVLAFLSG